MLGVGINQRARGEVSLQPRRISKDPGSSSWKTDETFGCRVLVNPKCVGRKSNQMLDSI